MVPVRAYHQRLFPQEPPGPFKAPGATDSGRGAPQRGAFGEKIPGTFEPEVSENPANPSATMEGDEDLAVLFAELRQHIEALPNAARQSLQLQPCVMQLKIGLSSGLVEEWLLDPV